MATADHAINQLEREQALPYVTNRWSRRVVQPLLISGMVTAFFAALLVLVQLFVPAQPVLRLIPLVWFVTIEGIYTLQWLHQPDQRTLDRLAYRGAELMLIFLIVRLYTWLIFNNWPDMSRTMEYLRAPGLILFGGNNLGVLILVLMAWGMALGTARLFEELAVSQWEARYFLTPRKERLEDQRPFQFNRLSLIDGFYVQWLWGGGIMLLFTAMSTLDLPTATRDFTLNVSRLGLNPVLLWALIVYFLAGLLLVSQGRLTAKTARWLREGVEKRIEVEESWYRNSWRLVLGTAVLTAFLPIGSTTPIGRLLSLLLGGLFALITGLFGLLIALLALLFPASEEVEEAVATAIPTAVATPPPTPMPPPPSQNNTEILEFVFSSAFWAVFIVLAIVAVGYFLRERGIKVNRDSAQTVWQRLVRWFTTAWRGVGRQARAFQRSWSQKAPYEPKKQDNSGSLSFNFIRVNGLLPREQIKYFYLSTLQRAAEKGVDRQESLTPEEFKATLLEAFPNAEEEIEQLTAAFQEARYSQKEFDKNDVSPVKKRWKQMRSSIRRKRNE